MAAGVTTLTEPYLDVSAGKLIMTVATLVHHESRPLGVVGGDIRERSPRGGAGYPTTNAAGKSSADHRGSSHLDDRPAETASHHGIGAQEMPIATLVGQPVHLLCPLVASTYLLCGLLDLDYGHNQRDFMKWMIGTCVVMFIAVLPLARFPSWRKHRADLCR